MIKIVFFDWNGTLLADTKAQFLAVCRAVECYGGRPPESVNELRSTLEISFFNYYVSRGCGKDRLSREYEKFREFYQEEYEKESAKCRTRRGSREILKRLKNKRVKSVILSNHPTPKIKEHLVRLGVIGAFSEVIGHPAQEEYYPKPDRMMAFLTNSGISPNETLVVGDSPDDIATAKATGAVGVAIRDGIYCSAKLRAAQPHHLISNILELGAIIESYRG